MIETIRFEDAAGSPLRPGNSRSTDSKKEFIIMNTFTKKTVFGVAGIAAAAALAIGAAGPASTNGETLGNLPNEPLWSSHPR